MLHFVICLFITAAGAAGGTWLAGFPADDLGLLLNVSRLSLADAILSVSQPNYLSEALFSILTVRDSYARQFLPTGFRSHFAGIGVLVSFFSYALSLWWLRNIAVKGKRKLEALTPHDSTKESGKKLLDKRDGIFLGRHFPRFAERLHTLIVGGTGSGKTQALRAFLLDALERGNLGFCLDYNCEHTPSLCREGDLLFSPYSKDYSYYSPLAELKSPYDAERVAELVIPEIKGGGEQAEWNMYARQLLQGTYELQYEMRELGIETNNRDTCLILSICDIEVLKKVFDEDSPALGFVRDGNERMAGSIFAIARSKAGVLLSLDPEAGFDSLSISDWVAQNAGKKSAPFIWMMVPEDFKLSGFPLASIMTGIYISACMKLPPVNERLDENDIPRRSLIIDEFGQAPRIAGMQTAVTAGRKHGICVLISTQSFAQLDGAYGENEAEELTSCLSSQLLMRANGSKNMKRCEEEVGQIRIKRTLQNSSETSGNNNSSKSSSLNSSVSIESKMLGSNFRSLKPRSGLSWFSGDDDWVFIKEIPARELPPKKFDFPEVREKRKRTGLSTKEKIQIYYEMIAEDTHEEFSKNSGNDLKLDEKKFENSDDSSMNEDTAQARTTDELMSFDDLGLE